MQMFGFSLFVSQIGCLFPAGHLKLFSPHCDGDTDWHSMVVKSRRVPVHVVSSWLAALR